jgi:hypothetical protein
MYICMHIYFSFIKKINKNKNGLWVLRVRVQTLTSWNLFKTVWEKGRGYRKSSRRSEHYQIYGNIPVNPLLYIVNMHWFFFKRSMNTCLAQSHTDTNTHRSVNSSTLMHNCTVSCSFSVGSSNDSMEKWIQLDPVFHGPSPTSLTSLGFHKNAKKHLKALHKSLHSLHVFL